MNSSNTLNEKIESRDCKVGIFGLGYVGLPLSILFAESGFKVFGFDTDLKKINKLNSFKSYIFHIKDESIKKIIKMGFTPTRNFSFVNQLDVIIICVPTPVNKQNKPDLSHVKNTIKSILRYLKPNQLIVLESTSYPGTTEEIIAEKLNGFQFKNSNSKIQIGTNFYVGYSPEREDPGNKKFTTKKIPKIVSGITNICLDLTNSLYKKIVESTVPVSSTRIAEMAKIVENVQRAINIGLMNELKIISNKLDININEVIKAASTKPFGFMPFYPGPGLGGHCIPIDPIYLKWKARDKGEKTQFIDLALKINREMPNYVIKNIKKALNSSNIKISKSKILILGLSYKKNVDDCRESPSLVIIDKLIKLGADVSFSDPYVSNFPKTRKYNYSLKSTVLKSALIKKKDIVVLLTDHDIFDYEMILKESRLIVDARGKFTHHNKKIFLS